MKKHLKLATLFVAAAISVAVVSCQKDKEIENVVDVIYAKIDWASHE